MRLHAYQFHITASLFRVHNQRLEAACTRALKGQIFNYRTIQNILVNNHDQLLDSPQPDLFRMPDHPNLREPESYQ